VVVEVLTQEVVALLVLAVLEEAELVALLVMEFLVELIQLQEQLTQVAAVVEVVLTL
jgi:hypothetical protein